MRVLYLVSGHISENRAVFRDRVLDFTVNRLGPICDSAVVAVTEERAPVLSVIPFRKDKIALISLEGVEKNASWPVPIDGFAGAYRSDVAYPVVHERDWDIGERSPGSGLLTMFRKSQGLDRDDFLRRWFEGHTPLTLEVHPNAGYVRNHVIDKFTPAGPVGSDWDGIVEEQYDPPSNLLNPAKFFGSSPWKMLPTMLRVYRDVKGFIDYSSIHTWLTAEYRLK